MKIPPRARMITAVVFVPWEPNSASTAWMSEAVRTTRGDCGSAVPDGADPDGACAGAGDVCAESARSSVEVTVDQYALGTRSGLARPSQFVTGGRPRHRPEATASPGGHRGPSARTVQTAAPAIPTRPGDLLCWTIRAPKPRP